MTTWDEPDHLKRPRQAARISAYRAEKSIWIERVQIEMMKRLVERPVATTLYVLLCGVILLGLFAMLSIAIGIGRYTIPGGLIFLTSTQVNRFMRNRSRFGKSDREEHP
jgi:hypothetical protein